MLDHPQDVRPPGRNLGRRCLLTRTTPIVADEPDASLQIARIDYEGGFELLGFGPVEAVTLPDDGDVVCRLTLLCQGPLGRWHTKYDRKREPFHGLHGGPFWFGAPEVLIGMAPKLR